MIILCLMAMELGRVLRSRLCLALGFAGLMGDLVSLLHKVLVLMERSARMTVVGSLVLLLGAALVFGAICNAFALCVLPSSFPSHSTRSQSGSVK